MNTDDAARLTPEMPSLEELWAVVHAQQETIAELASQVKNLGGEAVIASSRERAEPVRPARISRANLLKAATAGAGGLAAIGVLGSQVAGAETEKTAEVCPTLRVTGPKSASGIGVDASSISAGFTTGVYGASKTGVGVRGFGPIAVVGTTTSYEGIAVKGNASGYAANAVQGTSSTASGLGVYGRNLKGGIGIYGQSISGNGTGIYAKGNGYGLEAASVYGFDAVYGVTDGSNGGAGLHGACGKADGVYGESTDGNGVHGYSDNEVGVRGEAPGSHGVEGSGVLGVYGIGTTGSGVAGYSNSGAGGSFVSKSGPPLHLESGGTLPSGGLTGDFFVDSGGSLYFCNADGWVFVA